MGFPAESTDPTMPNRNPVPSMRSVPAATHSFQATIKMKPTQSWGNVSILCYLRKEQTPRETGDLNFTWKTDQPGTATCSFTRGVESSARIPLARP